LLNVGKLLGGSLQKGLLLGFGIAGRRGVAAKSFAKFSGGPLLANSKCPDFVVIAATTFGTARNSMTRRPGAMRALPSNGIGYDDATAAMIAVLRRSDRRMTATLQAAG